MSFDVDTGQASERGPRALNEDFVAVQRPGAGETARGIVAAIADGVAAGGQGRMAAQTSVLSVVQDYFGAPETWDTTVILDRVMVAHNRWLVAHNRRNDAAALSTLTALALRGQTWTLAHVGDTRAYLLRGNAAHPMQCQRLTQDHVMDHPDLRHRLTRAMGLDDALHADFLQGAIQVGDVFVLVSDGVHGALDPQQLTALAQGASAQDSARALVQAALQAGAKDNASALVLRVRGLDGAQLADAVVRSRTLPTPRTLRVGETIDGMVVTALIADNGVHRVYQVRSAADATLKALKALHPSRAHDAQERAMLAHEAWLSERVADHASDGFVRLEPNPAASEFYLLFAWHSGQTLERALRRAGPRGLDVADVVAWALAGACALGRLHRLGVVHRDIKPGNLHLGEDGRLRLLDLGVALSGQEPVEQRELHAGTPSYMSPELWDGAPATPASDLYAWGVTVYQMLCGHLPFGELAPYQRTHHRREPKPPSRLRPEVPIWLDRVVLKALARDPKARFETAEELVLALERGASRPLAPTPGTPLLQRDPALLWKAALAASVLFNVLLVVWLLFLPT
jgi:serine/threonine protein phosphatase PrpC